MIYHNCDALTAFIHCLCVIVLNCSKYFSGDSFFFFYHSCFFLLTWNLTLKSMTHLWSGFWVPVMCHCQYWLCVRWFLELERSSYEATCRKVTFLLLYIISIAHGVSWEKDILSFLSWEVLCFLFFKNRYIKTSNYMYKLFYFNWWDFIS